jgi:hypothetical protein
VKEARSFVVSSLRRRLGLVICREFARHRIRRVPYIGVPRAVGERRMQRGQLIKGPQARVPLYVPYADFFQYQAGAGHLAAWPAARTYVRTYVSAHARTPRVPQGGRGARDP